MKKKKKKKRWKLIIELYGAWGPADFISLKVSLW
jgi:hypothetical protein